jgi:chorismate mutase/prephenate dehydratase
MDLSHLRDRIDAVDRQIIALLAERNRIVEEVAVAKLEAASPFRDREREEHLLVRLREHATSAGVDPYQVERLYRIVMDMSVAHQEATVRRRTDAPLRVAYQGVEGSYSHLTAQRRFGGREGGALLTGFDTFRQAGDAVIHGAADLALLPIENTTAGSINETYDLFIPRASGADTGRLLHITGEVVSAIEHCLLALPGVALGELRTVSSHPQALAQCLEFFAAHPQLAAKPAIDTAGAARRVAELGDRTHAAIASAAAATTYGLEILATGIQTSTANATRFVEIALRPAPVPADARAKTSLLVALADRPGALGEILLRFAAHGLSLTKLESRPIPDAPFTYRFYVDVLGHAASAPFQLALAEVAGLTTELRILGTYVSEAR